MGLHRQATARLLLLVAVAAAFALAWRHFRSIPLLVLGQPRIVGQLQRDQEAPFFRTLAARTGLPLAINYRSADAFGLKDSHQLAALRDGRVDLVSLRFMQNIANEPSLEGLDLPGMIPDFPQGQRVIAAYGPSVDRYLQARFSAKLLGLWSFGPQVMVCRSPMTGLQDIRGRTVRVASPGLAQLLRAIGATPAILPFEDTYNALALGLVDCAVTSAASANFAGWTDHSRAYYPLAFQFGFNGYAISLRKWRSFSADEQRRIQLVFHRFERQLWAYSQMIRRQAESCIIGGTCRGQNRHRLTLVRPRPEDVALLQKLARTIVLPGWASRCERIHPGCRQDWDRAMAPILGLNGAAQGSWR